MTLAVAATLIVAASATASDGRSISTGKYAGGSLSGGVALEAVGLHHRLLFPQRCYAKPHIARRYKDASRTRNFFGHADVVAAVKDVARIVRTRFPFAPKIPVGELSNRHGGEIPGHFSHQNGLDVDVFYLHQMPTPLCLYGPSFERKDPTTGKWALAPGFQLAWNWALAEAFAARRDVKVIFVGGVVKRALADWAKKNVPKKQRWRTLSKLLAVYCRAPKGVDMQTYRNNRCPHDDHFHVRFKCPKDSPRCRGPR